MLVAVGARACLRVATAVGPDMVLLHPLLPRPLISLLRAHRATRDARISWSLALAPATKSLALAASGSSYMQAAVRTVLGAIDSQSSPPG